MAQQHPIVSTSVLPNIPFSVPEVLNACVITCPLGRGKDVLVSKSSVIALPCYEQESVNLVSLCRLSTLFDNFQY